MVLEVFSWLAWVVIGLIIGLLIPGLSRRSQGAVKDAVVGVFGAVVGGFVYSQLGLPRAIDFDITTLLAAAISAVATSTLIAVLNTRRADQRTDEATTDNTGTSGSRAAVDRVDRADINTRNPARIKVGRRWVHILLPVLLIVLLPILDVLLFMVRIPDISARPVQFGTVASYQNIFGKLDYLTYTPAGYQAGTPLPMLLFLHGCIIDPYILEAASGMRAIADKNNFIVVYPQQNSASSPHRCWNFYDPASQKRDSGEPSLLVGIVNQVKQTYSVDTRRVYVAGISSGGAMTSILGSCYPDVFAAAAVHSGLSYDTADSIPQALLSTMRGSQIPTDTSGRNAYACAGPARRLMPTFILHGTADTTVFPVNGDDTLQQFIQTNDYADDDTDNNSVASVPASRETRQVSGGHTYTVENFEYNGTLLLQKYTVDGFAHLWSGGTGVLPLADPKAPDASQLIWDFVSQYSLPG